MPDAPYALALAAGLLAAVNPCGFTLLPAYLSFLILDDAPDGSGRVRAAVRALTLTVAMTVGFVAVFAGFGLLAAPAANTVAQHLPWASIRDRLTLAAAGGWLLAGRRLPTLGLKISTGPQVTRRFGAMALFGASYAVASLGCTIGPGTEARYLRMLPRDRGASRASDGLMIGRSRSPADYKGSSTLPS